MKFQEVPVFKKLFQNVGTLLVASLALPAKPSMRQDGLPAGCRTAV
jgi:hypothetical protein